MEYQNILINRKEYFGLLWIAAHRPTKLSKSEVLHMDLSKKCKDLCEYIGKTGKTKKSNMKPKMSLLISSHLMKGLVIILHKKNVYLYDELVNLKLQISRSYIMPEQTIKQKKTKLKPTEKDVFALNENFPDLLDVSSIEGMMHVMDKTKQDTNYRNITLADDDLNPSALIHIDYDFTMDSFGGGRLSDGPFIAPNIDDYTLIRMDMENKLDSLVENTGDKPSLTSTVRKPAGEPVRAAFGNLTNVELGREEQVSMSQQNMRDTLDIPENTEFIKPSELMTIGATMPALFEPTVLEQATIPQEIGHEQCVQIPEISEIPARGMVKTFSADIQALKEDHLKKRQLIINRKRRNLIIDPVTEITVSSEEKAKRINRPMRPGTEEYIEQLNERNEIFRLKNPWLMTRNDYQFIDLFKEPLCKLSRRTERPFSSQQRNASINVRIMIENSNLTVGRAKDDEHFYLTQDRGDTEISAVSMLPISSPQHTLSMAEEKRQAEQEELPKRRLTFSEKISSDLKSKRYSSILNHRESLLLSKSGSRVEESLQPDLLHQHEEPIPLMQPLESFMAGDQLTLQTQLEEPKNNLIEIDNYEASIMTSIDEKGRVILQDLIQENEIPEKCKPMQKPRRFFAAKMFLAALSLAGMKSINLEQSTPNGPIVMSPKD